MDKKCLIVLMVQKCLQGGMTIQETAQMLGLNEDEIKKMINRQV